jgi:hypothetical protein
VSTPETNRADEVCQQRNCLCETARNTTEWLTAITCLSLRVAFERSLLVLPTPTRPKR